MMKYRRICLLGGTGFIGKTLAARLVARGHSVIILTRRPERHRGIAVLPSVRLVAADVHDEDTLARMLAGCDAAVNLVGILNESRRQSFRQVHVELPRKLTQACRRTGVTRLLHVSALKADAGNAPSLYLRTKGEGEAALRVHAGNKVDYTVFQPSLVFGPGGGFIDKFSGLLRIIPLMFPLACPQARFQPVYVGDVAEAMVRALESRESHGKRYALCGPRVYTLREIVEFIRDTLGLRRRIIGLPAPLGYLQAACMNLVPGKPFSIDNWHSLKVDSVCDGPGGCAALGIDPAPMETIVSAHLSATAS